MSHPDHLNAARLAFKKVREGLIEAAHAAGMLEADLVNLISDQQSTAPEEKTPEPAPEASQVAVKTYTHDDAKSEVTKIARSLTTIEEQQRFSQTVQSILQEFGAEKLSQLPAEKIADFINAVKERS